MVLIEHFSGSTIWGSFINFVKIINNSNYFTFICEIFSNSVSYFREEIEKRRR